MNGIQSTSLFTSLSAEAAQTVQGGRCHRRSYYRPYYYYSRPSTSYSYYPSFSYGYGYGSYGSYGYSGSSVNQSVNVNVVYED